MADASKEARFDPFVGLNSLRNHKKMNTYTKGASIATLVFHFRWWLARGWPYLDAARCRDRLGV